MRVQCKWGRLAKDGDVVMVAIGGSWCSPSGYVVTTYSAGEVDLFGCGKLDRAFLVPAEMCIGRRALWLRLRPSRNFQQACINLADDYDFIGAVAQLARAPRWQRGGQGFESPQLHRTINPPVVIGSHPFRNRLRYWMEQAAGGQILTITRRGKPLIRVGPA